MNTGKAGRRIRKTDNGFTLIELVAVLAILAVLAEFPKVKEIVMDNLRLHISFVLIIIRLR